MKSKLMITLAIIMMLSTSAMASSSFEILPLGGSFFPSVLYSSFDGLALAGWGSNYWSPATGWIVVEGGTIGNISGDGQTLIGTVENPVDGLDWAATYDVATGVWTLMDYLPGGEGCSDWGTGYAGSFDGNMATGLAWIPGCKARAFLWTEGVGTVNLGSTLEDRSSRGTDMSDDGSMVVGFDEAEFGNRQAAYWIDGVGPTVATPLGDPSEFIAVNSDGSAACGTWNNEMMFWSQATGPIGLGALPGETQGSLAIGISDNNIVVGQSGNPFFSFLTGAIWTVENGLMSAADFFAMYDVPVPEGFHFASVTGVSADGNTFVGAGLEPDGFLNMPWMVRLDTSVPTFLSFFDVQVSDGAVDLSFDVNGDALSIADFEVVVEYNGMEWTLPITRQGSAYVATDDSPELRQGGSATYSLYVIEDGNRSLVSSKSVDLDVMPAILTELKGAYPNPFNPMTKVAFSMANEGHVELSVYDASGRRVAVLANETFGAGDHTVTWQGRDDGGRALASGTYFVQMKSGSIYQHQKVNLVK